MPSSRASSPLSSASSQAEDPSAGWTERDGPVNGAHTSTEGEQVLHQATQARLARERTRGSREARSPTSSTVPILTDEESELTEDPDDAAEDEDIGDEVIVASTSGSDMQAPPRGISAHGKGKQRLAQEDSADDDEEEEEVEEVENDDEEEVAGVKEQEEADDDEEADEQVEQQPAAKRIKREDGSASPSPSLTPPPPSAILKSKTLPGSRHSTTSPRSLGRANGVNGGHGSLDDAPASKAENEDDEEVFPADEESKEDAEEDAEGDGDVTMKPEDAPGVTEADHGSAEDGQADQEDLEEVAEQEEAMLEDGAEDVAEEEGDAAGAGTTVPLPLRPPGHVHSSHAPPPPPAAIKALLDIEIKLAAFRDRLYLERMEESAVEEEMVLNGTHPALKYLNKTLLERRERMHEVSSKRHEASMAELVRSREAEKKHVWSWWTEQRDKLHWDEFQETWSKRRKLAREKNELETPRIVKAVPRVGDKSIRAFDWSVGAVPSKMSRDEALHDLALMDPRRAPPPTQLPQQPLHQQAHLPQAAAPARHASPMVYVPPQPEPQHRAPAPAQTQAQAGPSTQRAPAAQSTPAAGPSRTPITHTVGSRGVPPPSQPPPTFPYNQLHGQYGQRRATESPSQQASSGTPGGSRVGPMVGQSTHQLQQQQQRQQGRTVPTTSDMFEGKPSAPTGNSWRPAGSQPAAAPSTTEQRTNTMNRFPNLAEYLNGARSSTNQPHQLNTTATSSGATAYGNMLGANKVLSPPKANNTGSMGLTNRSPFGNQNPSATTATTTGPRP